MYLFQQTLNRNFAPWACDGKHTLANLLKVQPIDLIPGALIDKNILTFEKVVHEYPTLLEANISFYFPVCEYSSHVDMNVKVWGYF